MASYTSNLNLKKPAGSENVAIGDINNNMDTIDGAYGELNDKASKYNSDSQKAFEDVVTKAKSIPTGAVCTFSGNSSCGTSLIGTAGICFGMIKRASDTRLDYIATQPTGGRIAVGSITTTDSSVSITKVFS